MAQAIVARRDGDAFHARPFWGRMVPTPPFKDAGVA